MPREKKNYRGHVNAFKLDVDSYDALCKLAKEEERTIAQQIRYMLKRELRYAIRDMKREEYHADET